MKTQIITLESHDDLISVRDKFMWAKTPRILLVWPKYEKVALRLLDLKVLQRHAASLGAQLGLVTRRANVRRDAQSLGIPVFDSTAAAQKDPWPAPVSRSERIPKAARRDLRSMREGVYEKEAAWRTSLFGRVVTFSTGVLAVLAIAGVFIPRAAVTLYPEAQIQTVTIPVLADESVESVSFTGTVPAHTISVMVGAEQSLAIVNEIVAPNSRAQGIARFANLTQAAVDIPAGTPISTAGGNPVRYVTLHETLLPPGSDEFVDVPIQALQPGSDGNAPTGTIVVVEGELAVAVSVTNPRLVSGGTDVKLIGATESDRAALQGVVMDNLLREAGTKLQEQISSGDLYLEDTFQVSRIIEETYDPPAGQTGKTLTLTMQVEFSVRYVSEKDLDQLSLAALTSSIPEGMDPFDDPIVAPVFAPETDASGVTRFELEVTRTLLRRIREEDVFLILHGRRPQVVIDELMASLPLRKKPEIALTPSWWPWMPLIPFNISIESK